MSKNNPDKIKGWDVLWKAAGPSERDLMETLRKRARKQLTSVEQLVDYIRNGDEAVALAALVAAMRRSTETPYERHKRRARERQAAISRAGREIGPLPPVVDPERREACRLDLKTYLEEYHAPAFPLAWSEDHLGLIHRMQVVILVGALKAFAMPRGTGKSTISRAAITWALSYGHHRFAMLIGATDGEGEQSLDKIVADLETNPDLLADFPEICFPLGRLDQIHNRAKGQILDGRPTRITFGRRKLIFPDVAGSPAAGAIIKTGGILTAVRGAAERLTSGEILRPSLICIDDPQTRESAESPDQSATRERTISADVLGMAGPSGKIAAIMPCTVIAPGDLADNLLDREKHPDWRGERTKLLYEWPSDNAMDLWCEYDEIRRRFLKEDDDASATPKEATEYYREHRQAMDEGARIAWPERYRDDQISALQFAMDLFFRSAPAFFSEYQNEPTDDQVDEVFLSGDEIAKKTNGYLRRQVPIGTQWLTAFIDVHKRILFWTVIAWEPDFTGYVIDYGTWPKPRRKTFTTANVRPTLMEIYKKHGTEGAILAGLNHLADELLGSTWSRDDGLQMKIARLHADAGHFTTTVRKFAREHPLAALITPSFGRGIGPNEVPISQYRQRPGELIGEEWLVRKGKGRSGAHILFDANFWKTFFHRRLATANGDPGALSIFGRETTKRAASHQFFARQLDAERRDRVVGKRPVDQFTKKPGVSENHYFDCVVGATVAANLCGASTTGGTLRKPPAKSRASLAARRAAKRLNRRTGGLG